MDLDASIGIVEVECLGGFRVRLRFTDGAEKEIDLEPYLHGPIFEPIRREPDVFQQVCADPEIGTIAWPNGADIDPLVLRYDLTPAWQEDRERERSKAKDR